MPCDRIPSRTSFDGDRGNLPQTCVGSTRVCPGYSGLLVVLLMGASALAWISSPEPAIEPGIPSTAETSARVPALALAFSPDGQTIAASHPQGRVEIRDRHDIGQVRRVLPLDELIWSLAFSPDGRVLALGGAGAEILLCDRESGGPVRRVPMPIDQITALAFSADGQTLAVASECHKEVIVWDLWAGRLRMTLHGHSSPVLSIAFAPDGRSIVTGEKAHPVIRIWDLSPGRPRLRLELPRGRGPVRALACSPDGRRLASVSGGGAIQLWDWSSGRLDRQIDGFVARAGSVVFSPDGRSLASAGLEGQARVWSVATGRELRRLDGAAACLRAVAFSPDGRSLAAIGDDDRVRLWDLEAPGNLAALTSGPGRCRPPSGRGSGTASMAYRMGTGFAEWTELDPV